MAKLTNVYCTYTGGNIYVCTAKFGDVWLSTDFELYGTYDEPWETITDSLECDYDGHWKDSKDPLPTWQELLDAIRNSYETGVSINMDIGEVEKQIRGLHPDLSVRLNEPDPTPEENNSNRLETIAQFIEAFEDFLDYKGIVIQNDEKNQDPESTSNVYGSDYGILSDRIEELLVYYGVLD